MGLLRSVVDKVSESRAGKPMYVRHLAQGLRAADPSFDEQAYGFRTLTELVHLGQREGILRMQRDRQGAWRITSASPSLGTGAGAPASEPAGEAAAATGAHGGNGAATIHGEAMRVALGAAGDAGDVPLLEPEAGEPAPGPAAEPAGEAAGEGADGAEAEASGRRTASRRRKSASGTPRASRASAAKAAKPATTPRASRGRGGSRKKTTAAET
jgi:hypothetical protein